MTDNEYSRLDRMDGLDTRGAADTALDEQARVALIAELLEGAVEARGGWCTK